MPAASRPLFANGAGLAGLLRHDLSPMKSLTKLGATLYPASFMKRSADEQGALPPSAGLTLTPATLARGAAVVALVLFVGIGAALLNAPGTVPWPDVPDAIPTVDSRIQEVLRSDSAERTIR